MSEGYGLNPGEPVLCGGEVAGEQDFLGRLRCPAGLPVSFRRVGSTKRAGTDHLQREAIRLAVSERMARRLANADPEEIPLDQFLLRCDCGDHEAQIFIDMYFRGPEKPLGLEGWTLVEGIAPADAVEQVATCPQCGNPLRSPQARQCFECGADWH